MRASLVLAIAVVALAIGSRHAEACRGCKAPTLTELAKQADRIVAGTVESADGKDKSVVAVSIRWKGESLDKIPRTGCWRLFERKGAKVIVLGFPDTFATAWSDECLGVYADTPENRAVLTKLFGDPK